MNKLQEWLAQMRYEKPDDRGATPTTPNGEDTTPTADGDDTAAAASGDDTAPAADGDLLTPPGDSAEAGPQGDLLNPPAEGEFDLAEVSADDFKKMFDETSEWDDEALTGFLEHINKSGSRADMAKNLVEYQSALMEKAQETANAEFQSVIDGWRTEARAHPTLGGTNMDKTMGVVRGFIDAYADNPALTTKALTDTGLSNNIHVIQLLHKAAESVSGEARPAEGAPVQQDATIADRLFGSSPN